MSDPAHAPGLLSHPPLDGELLLSAFRKVAARAGLTLPNQAAILGVSRATIGGWKTTPGLGAAARGPFRKPASHL